MKKLLLRILVLLLFLFLSTNSYALTSAIQAVVSTGGIAAYAGFTDGFNGTNGDAPSTTNWTSMDTSGTFEAGSYFNIQSNVLKFYGKKTSGTCMYQYRTKTELSTAANRAFTVTMTSYSPLGGANGGFIYVFIYNSANDADIAGFTQKNAVLIGISGNTGTNTITHYNLDADGTYSAATNNTFSPTGTDVLRVWLVDSTHVSASVNGTTLINNVAITGSFGTNIKASIVGQQLKTDGFTTWTIGEIKWE